MNIDLTDRVVLVTGASRGIGRATAEALGAAGATVAVHFRAQDEDAQELAANLGAGSRAFGADLADAGAAEELFANVLALYGRLDALVNNAGIFEPAPLSAAPADWAAAWDRTMAVNLRAVGILCREACLHFAERCAALGELGKEAPIVGRIVNVASRAAFRGDDMDYLAYGASKAGVVALTRSIARHMGRRGVTAFTVAPGFTRTDMAAPYIAEHGESAAAAGIALPRLTQPHEVAPTIVFLASGLADHATGATIDINAGSYVH